MYPYIYLVLPSYAVMAFIGAFFILILTYLRSDKFGIDFTDFLRTFIVSAIGIFLGSKILYSITQIPCLLEDFSFKNLLILLAESGYVYYGGLFGALIAIRIYTKHVGKYEVSDIYRLIAPAIPLFHGFGRIGCLLAGCCYGKQLKNPVIIFNTFQFERVPTQIIEAIFEFTLFGVLLLLEKKRKINLLRVYLISYGLFRFMIEFFRGDIVRGIFFGLSTAQWISLSILVYYIFSVLKKYMAGAKREAVTEGGKNDL